MSGIEGVGVLNIESKQNTSGVNQNKEHIFTEATIAGMLAGLAIGFVAICSQFIYNFEKDSESSRSVTESLISIPFLIAAGGVIGKLKDTQDKRWACNKLCRFRDQQRSRPEL